MRGSEMEIFMKITGMYGNWTSTDSQNSFLYWDNGSQVAITYGSPPGSDVSPSPLPDGSGRQCNLGSASGRLVDATICPLGLANPLSSSSSVEASSSSEQQQSSSSAGSSDSQGSSNSNDLIDKCRSNPHLPECSCTFYPNNPWCNECALHPELAFCNGNGNCSNLNDCNWARIDVQLEQYGVEKEIRDKMKDLHTLLEMGYNLSSEQKGILEALINAVNSGSDGSIEAINRLGSRLDSLGSGIVGGVGDKIDGMLDGIKDFFSDLFGKGDCEGDGCAPGGLGAGDTSGFSSKVNKMIAGGGKGFAPWTNSQIEALIPIKMASGQCPVIDKQLSFFGTSIPFKIDFNNLVNGFDWAKFMKSCLLITVYFINTFSMIQIFRSGGRK